MDQFEIFGMDAEGVAAVAVFILAAVGAFLGYVKNIFGRGGGEHDVQRDVVIAIRDVERAVDRNTALQREILNAVNDVEVEVARRG